MLRVIRSLAASAVAAHLLAYGGLRIGEAFALRL